MLLQRSTWTLFSFNVRLNIIQEKEKEKLLTWFFMVLIPFYCLDGFGR